MKRLSLSARSRRSAAGTSLLLMIVAAISLLLFATPTHAQCNPSYDPECPNGDDGIGPLIWISPDNATYTVSPGETKSVVVSVALNDNSSIDRSSLRLTLTNGTTTETVSTFTWEPSSFEGNEAAKTTVSMKIGQTVLTAVAKDIQGNAGSGTATVRVDVLSSPPDPHYPLVQAEIHHNDYRDLGRAQLNLGYAPATYTSMGQAKTTGVLYSSGMASPVGYIQVDAGPDPRSGSRVVAMSLRVCEDGTNRQIGRDYYWKKGTNFQRMGVSWSMRTKPTGAHHFRVEVRSHFNDGTETLRTQRMRVLVVNEVNSRYGAGWTIAGIQQLYSKTPATEEGVIVREDTIARWFARTGCTSTTCSYQTPDGDFSQLVYQRATGTWLRTYSNGATIAFDARGLATRVADKFGRATTYVWQNTSDPQPVPVLRTITDPAGKVTSLNYSPSGYLLEMIDPAGRRAAFQHSGTDLVQISATSNFSVTYNSAHMADSYTNESGTWNVNYYRNAMSSVYAPAVTVNGRSVRPHMQYQRAEWKATLLATQGLDLANPADAVLSSEAVDEDIDTNNHKTRILRNRYGQPLSILDAAGRLTEARWTKDGLPLSVEEPGANVTMYDWDPQGRLLTKFVGSALVYEATYEGNVLKRETAGGSTRWFRYGPSGEVIRTWYGAETDADINGTTYEYDGLYRLVGRRGPKGERTEWGYTTNAWGNVDLIRDVRDDGTTSTTRYTYDTAGLLNTTTNALGAVTITNHDFRNRLISVIEGSPQKTTRLEYSGEHLTKVTDPASKIYRFTYNALGWRESAIFPDGRTRTYAYDADGLLTAMTDRRGLTVRMTHDALHRVATRTADGATATYNYPDAFTAISTNAEGVVTTKLLRGVGEIDFVSSSFPGLPGRLYELKNAFDHIAWRHLGVDINSYLNGAVLSSSSIRENAAPALGEGRSLSIADPTGRTTTFDFNAAGEHVRTAFPNGIAQSNVYGSDGDLRHMTFSSSAVNGLLGTSYTYDLLGRLSSRSNLAGNAQWNYAYDSFNRVQSYEALKSAPTLGCNPSVEECPPLWNVLRSENFTYDGSGNRTDRGASIEPNSNRYVRFGDFTLQYDLEGNLTRKTKLGFDQQLTWNSLGQLASVTTNGATVTYGYDALNRRVRRTANGQARYFMYDDDDLMLEIDSTGEIVRTYTHLPGVDRPLSLRARDAGMEFVYYYVLERNGSVRAVLNSTGGVAAEYHYTPFGEIENSTNALQPLRFMGRELDADTSLYYVRNRWYDPVLGRFVSEDPIGLRGGINPYTYVGNDPVNLRDPQGLSPTCSTFISVTGDEWEAIGAQSREALESLGICLSVTLDTLVVNGGMPNGVAPIPPAPPDNAWLCPSCAGKIPTSHQGPTIGPGMPMTWVKQRIANAAAECRQWRRWAAAWTLLHIAGDVRQVMTTPAPTVTPGDSRVDLSGYGSDLASNYGESATAMANERCKALGVP